jgi:hypothetical protein
MGFQTCLETRAISVNVPTMQGKVVQEVAEIRVVVVKGFAFGVSNVDGKDAVEVVGLHEAAVASQERELLAGFELSLGYGFEMGHGVAPSDEVPVREQGW